MSRSPAVIMSCVFMIQPSGWALPADPNSMWANFLSPMCAAWSAIEAQAAQFATEIDPRTSVLLIPEWEQLLGPDPCGRDLLATTLQAKQSLNYQRLTSRGGQSIPYFVALAASLGETATIQEATWSRFGMMRFGATGARFAPPSNQFNWSVQLAQRVVTKFRFGASQFSDRFGSFTASMAQCPITHAAPAHTVVTFNYSGTETH